MFHRLVAPSYFSPPSVDYFNNALAGVPAIVAPARTTGPNLGTLFVGAYEDAIAGAFNRGLNSLAENSDVFDDFFHRDLAVPQRLVATAGGLGDGSVIIPGPIWVGAPGTPNTVDGIRSFIAVVDDQDNELFNGSECLVTAITGAVPGAPWSAGNVTLTISPVIPAAQAYRVYYYERSNVSAIDREAFTFIRQSSRYNGGPNWADGTGNPVTTVSAQLDKMLSDLSGTGGTAKVGSLAVAGAPYELFNDTLYSQLVDIMAAINSVVADTLAYTDALRADLTRVRFLTTAATHNNPAKDALLILNPAATFALQLSNPATCPGQQTLLINGDGTMAPGNKVTLTRFGGENINGLAADFDLLAPYGRWILSSDGVDWNLI